MCKVDKESNDRALAHCSKAKFLWQLVISYLVWSGWWTLQLKGTFWVDKTLSLKKKPRKFEKPFPVLVLDLVKKRRRDGFSHEW